MLLAERPSTSRSHPRTCSYHLMLLSLSTASLLVLLYTSLSVSFTPATTSLPLSSLSPTLARTILSLSSGIVYSRRSSGPSFATASTIPSYSFSSSFSSISSLQGIALVTLLWTEEARSWHSLGAACSSGKVALGAYNVRCKTD